MFTDIDLFLHEGDFCIVGVFAAFDLYGQCVQVTIVSEDRTNADFALCRTPSSESLIDESMLGE